MNKHRREREGKGGGGMEMGDKKERRVVAVVTTSPVGFSMVAVMHCACRGGGGGASLPMSPGASWRGNYPASV